MVSENSNILVKIFAYFVSILIIPIVDYPCVSIMVSSDSYKHFVDAAYINQTQLRLKLKL